MTNFLSKGDVMNHISSMSPAEYDRFGIFLDKWDACISEESLVTFWALERHKKRSKDLLLEICTAEQYGMDTSRDEAELERVDNLINIMEG